MKKVLFASLVFIFGFILVGCGGSDVPEPETEAPEVTEVEVDDSADEVDDIEDEGLDTHAALMANGEEILGVIDMLFPIENASAFNVQVRENGTLLLIPEAQEWIDFQALARDNEDVGEVIADSLITLSETIRDTFGIEGVEIQLMIAGSDAMPAVTVEDGEIGINLYE